MNLFEPVAGVGHPDQQLAALHVLAVEGAKVTVSIKCIFQPNPMADSGARRSPIPGQADHRFQRMAITIPAEADHFEVAAGMGFSARSAGVANAG